MSEIMIHIYAPRSKDILDKVQCQYDIGLTKGESM